MDALFYAPNIMHQRLLRAYEEYADALFRHCYFRVYNRERAEELVQETFMKAWEYLRDGKEVKNMRAFLYKVAVNLIIDDSRKKKRERELSLDLLQEKGFDPGIDDRDRLSNQIEGKRLMLVLDQLEEKYRSVITMRFVDNLTPQEIAMVTGENPNVVSVRIHRGIKQVRKLLGDLV